jgi:hypothetical protein
LLTVKRSFTARQFLAGQPVGIVTLHIMQIIKIVNIVKIAPFGISIGGDETDNCCGRHQMPTFFDMRQDLTWSAQMRPEIRRDPITCATLRRLRQLTRRGAS